MSERRRRTTWNGWRIVAGGVLFLIFGFTFLTNDIGPLWFSALLILAGAAAMVYGRRH